MSYWLETLNNNARKCKIIAKSQDEFLQLIRLKGYRITDPETFTEIYYKVEVDSK